MSERASLVRANVLDDMERKNYWALVGGGASTFSLSDNLLYRGTQSLYITSLDTIGIINTFTPAETVVGEYLSLLFCSNAGATRREITIIVVGTGGTKTFTTGTDIPSIIENELQTWFQVKMSISGLSTIESVTLKSVGGAFTLLAIKDLINYSSSPFENIPLNTFHERSTIRTAEGDIPNQYGAIRQDTGQKPREFSFKSIDSFNLDNQYSMVNRSKYFNGKDVYYFIFDKRKLWYPVKRIGLDIEPRRSKLWTLDFDLVEYTEIGDS